MTDIDLNALEATARAATPGPWYQGRDGRRFESSQEAFTRESMFAPDSYDAYPTQANREDAAFVATFNPATALALIARLREAENVIEVVEENLGGPKRMSDGYMSYFVTEDAPIRVALDAYKTTKTERDESEFAPGECDGSGTCTASVHVHGCYRPHRSDECDSPDEYGHTDREDGSRDA